MMNKKQGLLKQESQPTPDAGALATFSRHPISIYIAKFTVVLHLGTLKQATSLEKWMSF